MGDVGAPAAALLPPRRLPRPDAASLRQLYVDESLTVAALATRLGISAQTAHNWLVSAGVARRAAAVAARVEVSDDDVRRLYAVEGWTAAEVGAHLGCATSTVYARLERLGVPRRPARPRQSSRPPDDELRQLYLQRRLSLRQLAQRFSVSSQAVGGWLEAAGIPRRRPGGPGSAGESDSLVELYGQGWSGPHLGARFGCSTATVYRRLEAAGAARRRQPPAIDRPGLLEALDAGLSGPELAARFDVSVSAVCRALAREGLQTASQAARRHAADHYVALLEVAERSGTADRTTIDWLRRRARPEPPR